MIHESAIIDPSAKIADDVEIGAYSIIDKNVYISEDCDQRKRSYPRKYIDW